MTSLSQEDLLEGPVIQLNYERHRPEETLLRQIIAAHCPHVQAHLAEQGKQLPAYVIQTFEAFLKCACLQQSVLRVRCETCRHESWAHSLPPAAITLYAISTFRGPRSLLNPP